MPSGGGGRNGHDFQPGPSRYKELERKREGFRRYLEHQGILDMLSKVLSELHERGDLPPNGCGLLRSYLASSIENRVPELMEIEVMQFEMKKLQQELAQTKDEKSRLENELQRLHQLEYDKLLVVEPLMPTPLVKTPTVPTGGAVAGQMHPAAAAAYFALSPSNNQPQQLSDPNDDIRSLPDNYHSQSMIAGFVDSSCQTVE